MNIVFLGPPGVGKGTQSDLLISRLNFYHMTTGHMLRNYANSDYEFSQKVKSLMAAGSLISDNLVEQILRESLVNKNNASHIIFDGIPRNLSQVHMLDRVLDSLDTNVDCVFNFYIEPSILVKRVTGRFVCGECSAIYNDFFSPTLRKNKCDVCGSSNFIRRSDDNPKAFETRIRIFSDNNKQIREHYSKNGLLFDINADRFSLDIFFDLKSVLDKLN